MTADVQRAIEESVQSRAQGDQYTIPTSMILTWMRAVGDIVSPWWSRKRDFELQNFARQTDQLSSAVYTVRTKITTLPFQIVPKDTSVRSQVRQAESLEQLLHASDFGGGWESAIGKWVEDVLTTDNGGFLEVVGGGPKDGPIVGPALGLAHLDSLRCWRTSDPQYPVVYEDDGGTLYKLHFSRVITYSQMSSPRQDMHGVGFCAISRTINVGQNFSDQDIYRQESYGSRPPRKLLVGSNITADEIADAFRSAQVEMDNANLRRYSRTIAVGAKSKDIRIDSINLTDAPNGYDERTSITLGMFTIALGFGVDARELWPASDVGATKADAMVQHLKARGKTIGQLLRILKWEIERKFLPTSQQFVFDDQDDEQDNLRAEINKSRSETRERDLGSEVITIRVVREKMLEDGEINDSQFESMELSDGRLPDGSSVLTLFQWDDSKMRKLLGYLDPETATDEEMTAQIRKLESQLFTARNSQERMLVEQAITALTFARSGSNDSTSTPTDEANEESGDQMLEGTGGPSQSAEGDQQTTDETEPEDDEVEPEDDESMLLKSAEKAAGQRQLTSTEFSAVILAAERILGRREADG